jgi:hypothetical protein
MISFSAIETKHEIAMLTLSKVILLLDCG